MRLICVVAWLAAVPTLAQPVDPEPAAPQMAAPPPRASPPAPREKPTAISRLSNAVGFGFFGTSLIDEPFIGPFVFTGAILTPARPLSVPLVGARWWTPWAVGPIKRVGLEAAFGVASTSGSRSTANLMGQLVSDTDTHLGFAVHLSVPLALASTEHTVIFFAPEFRYTADTITPSGTVPLNPGARAGQTAASLATDLSLRAGLELFFGFIQLPNLSIEASIRVGIRWLQVTSLPNGQMGGPQVDDSVLVNTSLVNNVFDLFTGSISAKYYL